MNTSIDTDFIRQLARFMDLDDLKSCMLCEYRCGVDRTAAELGVCRAGASVVANQRFQAESPESHAIFMAGCNFKCLNCNTWRSAHYPDNGLMLRGHVEPAQLAAECLAGLAVPWAKRPATEQIFFTGGEPTIHLPYLEQVVTEIRKRAPETRVNLDTNGFMTEASLERTLRVADLLTYDLKAYYDDAHRALTGAPAGPALRNARDIARYAREQLWEFRILVIPKVTETEVRPLSIFLAEIDPSLPVCFLAFKPAWVLEDHPGATRMLMERCVAVARQEGLRNVSWSGRSCYGGAAPDISRDVAFAYTSPGAQVAATWALEKGCDYHPRDCGACAKSAACPLKRHHGRPSENEC